jgi:uncharacterized protein YcbK (DUF882 family)
MGISVSTATLASKRTISFYSLNTRESLTVTYKRDGRYIPRAMRKLNYILRDWRANKTTRMDPKVIDLVWELHKELRSNKPIHLVSGYRSPKTNAMRRRQSRGVAKHSRHIRGQAIDLYFPDVSIKVLRESALIKQRGGVGYYPRSHVPFVHIDTGNVRHWPRMPAAAYASLLRRGKGYIRMAARKRRAPTGRERAARLRIASAMPASPIRSRQRGTKRNNRPENTPRPFPALALKNPPIPKRKPILVALNMAPRGESWLTPSGAPGVKIQTRIVASAASITRPASSTWEAVKRGFHRGADTLMAFAGKPVPVPAKRTTVRKKSSDPMRLAKASPGPETARIINSFRNQVTTARIHRPSTTAKPAIRPETVSANPLLMASIKPHHVWSATPLSVASLMRAPVQFGSPAFSGTLFGKLEKAVFTLAPQQIASARPAASRTLVTGSTRRRIKAAPSKRGWISRLFSDWGLTRPANAKTNTTRNASVEN